MLVEKPRSGLCRSQPSGRQTSKNKTQTNNDKHLGEGRKGWHLSPFPGGSTGLLASQATEDVLASRVLNQSKNHCYSSGYAFSCLPSHEKSRGQMLRMDTTLPPTPPKGSTTEQQEVAQKPGQQA